jgi:hypothetical protein
MCASSTSEKSPEPSFDIKRFLEQVKTQTDPTRISARLKLIMTEPKNCWSEIVAEPISVEQLLTRYIIAPGILAAVCRFIGTSIFGDLAIHFGLSNLIMGIVLYPISVLAGGWLVSKLAPHFGGSLELINGAKLIGFSFYPSVLGSLFFLIPIGMIQLLGSLVGLYGLYVLWLGVMPCTNVPEDRMMPFFVTLVAGSIVIATAFSFTFGAFLGLW